MPRRTKRHMRPIQRAVIFVTAPAEWTDTQLDEVMLNKIDTLIEKLEGALITHLREISPDLNGWIE